ncbi:MAG: rhomboid family intramembrane serine protease [Ilumatobacteraceae bacterium]
MPGRYEFNMPGRRERDGWFKVGSIDVTTTAFMVLAGVASMFWYAVDQQSLSKLVYVGEFVRQGELWRLVTWPLVNPPESVWVVLTLAFFWFVGHAIEDRIGRKKFTVLVLLCTVLPSLLVTIIPFANSAGAYGLGLLGIAFLVVFALDNPGAMFFFGIPAWVIAAVYVGIDVLFNLGNRQYERLVLELAIIVMALGGARQYGMLDDLQFIPRFGGGAPKAKAAKPARSKSAKGGGDVVAGPWGPPTTQHSAIEELELNQLLDKISAQGMDALSKTEKARLNELSKKLRGR